MHTSQVARLPPGRAVRGRMHSLTEPFVLESPTPSSECTANLTLRLAHEFAGNAVSYYPDGAAADGTQLQTLMEVALRHLASPRQQHRRASSGSGHRSAGQTQQAGC